MAKSPKLVNPPQGHGSAPSRSSTKAFERANGSAAQPLEDSINDTVNTQPQIVEERDQTRPSISVAVTQRLYSSHLLSTWNSRSFEFGAVLFLASIFPLTLLPLSIYALVRSASAILLAPTIGRAVDRKGRLPLVRFSIGEPHTVAGISQTHMMQSADYCYFR